MELSRWNFNEQISNYSITQQRIIEFVNKEYYTYMHAIISLHKIIANIIIQSRA